MLDVRYSHLYFYQSLNRLQRGLSAIAELLVGLMLAKVYLSLSWKYTLYGLCMVDAIISQSTAFSDVYTLYSSFIRAKVK